MQSLDTSKQDVILSESKDQLPKLESGQIINSRNLLPSEYWDILSYMSRRDADQVVFHLVETNQLFLIYIGEDSAGYRQYLVP